MSRTEEKGTHTTFMQESYIHCVIWIAVASSKGIYILFCKQQIKLKEQKTGSQNSPPLIPNKINIFKKTKANTSFTRSHLIRKKPRSHSRSFRKCSPRKETRGSIPPGRVVRLKAQFLHDALSAEEEHY